MVLRLRSGLRRLQTVLLRCGGQLLRYTSAFVPFQGGLGELNIHYNSCDAGLYPHYKFVEYVKPFHLVFEERIFLPVGP